MSASSEDNTTAEAGPGGPAEATRPSDPWTGFEPYAQICGMLLPRAQGLRIFDARGALRWPGDADAAAELSPVIAGAIAEAHPPSASAGDLRILADGKPAYLFSIRDDSHRLLAIAAVVCARDGAQDIEARSVSMVHALLRPALECLRRDLLARVAVGRLRRTVAELDRMRRSSQDGSFDSLTGLYTRPAFETRVRLEVAGAGNASPWASLYINVDQLHVINDSFGMKVGDGVLGQLGELLRSRLPPRAFAARISGDRFAVLVPGQLDDAERFGELLREAAELLGTLHGNSRLRVSISVGVAELDPREGELIHSLAAAETACKAAKDRGRNRVEVYRSNDVSLVRRFADINIAGRLHDAISCGRLRLDAQLIQPFGREPGLTPHYELLVRMLDEDGVASGPDTFMSAAMRYQLMPSIDRWVIETAIERLKGYAATFSGAPLRFAINFSGQSLSDETFEGFLIERIASSRLAPELFCFELTENATIASIARATALMSKLRALGCGIALDDFGTGLSSLSYLRQLPVTMLKIDGSFVRDVVSDPRAESMVRAIAQLARTMSLTTVAEYVETEGIRSRVATLGVDYGQGYAIARPVPLDDLLAGLTGTPAAGAQRRVTNGARGADSVSAVRRA